MNIRVRLTLWYTTILFLILVIFSAAVYLGLTRNLLSALDIHLQREAGQIIGGVKFENEGSEAADADHEGSFEIEAAYVPEEGVFWRILDTQGRTLIDPGYFDETAVDSVAMQTDRTQFAYAVLPNNTPIRLYTVPFEFENGGAGIVQVAES
jgi:hypothetical protein